MRGCGRLRGSCASTCTGWHHIGTQACRWTPLLACFAHLLLQPVCASMRRHKWQQRAASPQEGPAHRAGAGMHAGGAVQGQRAAHEDQVRLVCTRHGMRQSVCVEHRCGVLGGCAWRRLAVQGGACAGCKRRRTGFCCQVLLRSGVGWLRISARHVFSFGRARSPTDGLLTPPAPPARLRPVQPAVHGRHRAAAAGV